MIESLLIILQTVIGLPKAVLNTSLNVLLFGLLVFWLFHDVIIATLQVFNGFIEVLSCQLAKTSVVVALRQLVF